MLYFQFFVICSPVRRASYSALLFEQRNSNLSEYVHTSPSKSVSTTPAPDPSPLNAPSINKDQQLFMEGTSFTFSSSVFPLRIYVRKSAIACPLMLACGLKHVSSSPNSMTYLVTLPGLSGCSNTYLIGWLVSTQKW